MASLACRASGYMVAGFAQSSCAIMATGATSSNARMVHRRAAFKAGGGFVAGFASSRGCNVCAWFKHWRHARKGRAIMASRATCGNARMVHRGASKAYRGFMASFATGVSRNMISWFGQTSAAHFVASRATCSNARMIHRRAAFKAGGGFVASFASSGGSNMCGWFKYWRNTCKGGAAVTTRTTRCDANVIHGGASKACG